MNELFRILKQRLELKQDTVLVTVIEGKGSLPRTAGAYMAVGEEGRLWGTVGGGNLEYQSIEKAQNLLHTGDTLWIEYDLGAGEAAELGMVCGGRAKVLFSCLKSDSPGAEEWVRQGISVCEAHSPYWLLLPLENDRIQIAPSDRLFGQPLQHRKIQQINGTLYYAEQFASDGRVYLFGGGHLAQELVPLLSHVGFRCVVADDRPEFADPVLFPQAEEVILTDFAHLEEDFQIGREDYVAVMTRGHLWDAEAERFALRTPACYIGVVGSRRKTRFVREKLLAEGFPAEQLDRVTEPIGLDIHSETPAEIAVSITAQLIQVRAEKLES